MIFLFLHRSFPAQFKYIASILAKNPNNVVMFITAEHNTQIEGITKLEYSLKKVVSDNCHPFLKVYEETVLHAQAAAEILTAMKKRGIKPDIIFGFSWGTPMFVKDVFPQVPFLCYFEWFGKIKGSAHEFVGYELSDDQKALIKCGNTHVLLDLLSCDAGISPTEWQKSQFPKEFQHKIKVIHDGINTDICKPDENAEFDIALVEERNLEICHCEERGTSDTAIQKIVLTKKDEVITYSTRGMEPARGFPEFMRAVEILLTKRPNAHFVIAGADTSCYSAPLEKGTYKELMLENLNIDMNRVHFVDTLPYEQYLKLLQISSVHVYLTYPIILSWSFLEAMSAGCCIVASNTAPVTEVMKDNYNGLLVDFYDVNRLVEKIEYALENKAKMEEIRKNARQTIVDNYSLKELLPKQIEYMLSLIKK